MIEFRPETHQYFVEGVEYPSVTSMLKDAGLVDDRWFTDPVQEKPKPARRPPIAVKAKKPAA